MKTKVDFIVRVDRSVKPNYPSQIKRAVHPELELTGPAEYSLQDSVKEWLHDGQKCGAVKGNSIYHSLQSGGVLATCLNLQDGIAIQTKGIDVFRKLFVGKVLALWGSVIQHNDGYLRVPCLWGDNNNVGLFWHRLNGYWFSNHPALHFKK